MTLSLERARSRRPVTWITVLGVLLLPVLIGGILLAALYNPTERLDNVRAAIVNNDQPVTINGQTAPLGRQLTAGLVEGSSDVPSNLDWVISNTDDAASGLADGTYDAVITIPQNFSAAATSTAPGKSPEQATIQVQTAPDSRVVDGAITATITQTAASVFGSAVSQQYLTNVLMGFTNLHDQLGQAASGADQLASGAQQAGSGATQLSSGVTQLASGADQLATGAAQAAAGAAQLPSGASSLADGARTLGGHIGDLAVGLDQAAATVVNQKLKDAAAATTTAAGGAVTQTTMLGTNIGALAQECAVSGASPELCGKIAALLGDPKSEAPAAGTVAAVGRAAGTAQYIAGQTSTGIDQLMTETSAGLTQAADGARQLQGGAGELAAGADQLAAGASSLSDGVSQVASGAQGLADGAGELSTGASQLSSGVNQLATGSDSLAQGLNTAVSQIPTYSQEQADATAKVVANPVSADGIGTNLFGASAIPLLAMLALWFGGLGSFIALQAVPRHALSSRRPSVLLALRSLAPAAGIGAAQGLLVAGVAQLAANYDAGTWFAFAGLAMVAGVSFAAVNQALVAVFGGAGRWIATLVGVLAMATGIVSTIPGILASIADVMPTTPAYTALLAVITPAGGAAAGFAGMLVWAALAFVASTIAVARRRTANARTLLGASPALV